MTGVDTAMQTDDRVTRWIRWHPWMWVMVEPTRFFRQQIVTGAQARGLVFAMSIVLVEEASRFVFRPDAIPMITSNPVVSAAIAISIAVVLVTPVALHLITAIQTIILIPIVRDRAAVSETVQVFAYSAAPCVFVGVPVPELRVLAAGYGAYLALIGLRTIHGITMRRAIAVGIIPIVLVFGYGFRGVDAIGTVLSQWYLI